MWIVNLALRRPYYVYASQFSCSSAGVHSHPAGLPPEVIYKELTDYRTGKRNWVVMNAVATGLSDQDTADVAAYYSSCPRNNLVNSQRTAPSDADISRLVTDGDPTRNVVACAACHGPEGVKIRQRPRRLVHRHGAHRSAVPGKRSGARVRRERDVRAGCSHRVAHTSAGSDPACHSRLRLGAARGRSNRGNSAWRCGAVPARGKALAWHGANNGGHSISQAPDRSFATPVPFLAELLLQASPPVAASALREVLSKALTNHCVLALSLSVVLGPLPVQPATAHPQSSAALHDAVALCISSQAFYHCTESSGL